MFFFQRAKPTHLLIQLLAFCIPVTYPLDLTKTRLQIQGEVAAASHGGINVSIRLRKLMSQSINVVGLSPVGEDVNPLLSFARLLSFSHTHSLSEEFCHLF
jgi:hypothetical protein